MAGFPIVVAYNPPARPWVTEGGQPVVDLYSGLARKPTHVPDHLTRVLYFPKHDTPNFSVYDVSDEFRRVLHESPFGGGHLLGTPLLGSRLFNARLAMLNRPSGDGGDNVQYLVYPDEATSRHGGISAILRKRDPRNICPNVNVKLPLVDDCFQLVIDHDKGSAGTVDIGTFYPLPDAKTHTTRISFPYFDLSVPHETEAYQWQIHPIDDGPLRYTLVSKGRSSEDPSRGGLGGAGNVMAIYYHVGRVGSLFTLHSEGILLLPECSVPALPEEIIVASLVGVLARVRSMRKVEQQQGWDSAKPRGKSFLKKLIC